MDNVLMDGVYYTISEVAKLLNICEETVRRWCRNGKIVAYKRSDGPKAPWRIMEIDLACFLLDHPKYEGYLHRNLVHDPKLVSGRIRLLTWVRDQWKRCFISNF